MKKWQLKGSIISNRRNRKEWFSVVGQRRSVALLVEEAMNYADEGNKPNFADSPLCNPELSGHKPIKTILL